MVNRIGFCYVNLVNKMKSLKGVLDSVEDSVVIIEPESSEVLYSNQAAKAIRIRTSNSDEDSWSLMSDQTS